MLVTIVLPTFNGEKYITETIHSCLNQTFKNIELIIVNDSSTDNTYSIISELSKQDERIRIINNESNKKLPASLNIGFENAKGELFTWISDDNFFAPDAIETMASVLLKNIDVDIVYSSYYFIDETGNLIDKFGCSPEELIFKCAPGACFLYKRSVHEELRGFDITKFRMEDMDFWLRASTKFKYKYIDNVDLYYYRKHSDSLTANIFSDPSLYKEYRANHRISFQSFLLDGFGIKLTEEELDLHLELYFEDISLNKNWDFDISEKVAAYIEYLDKLSEFPWGKVSFDEKIVKAVLRAKKDKIIKLVINDLFFENQILSGQKPHLASHFNKPISWYYKEYEVLPGWYKKVGHIIKALQGNRPWKSLLNNQEVG
jgi:glycosyltransferase involved in cell wall biosynthesis